jgi:hypothetical protein
MNELRRLFRAVFMPADHLSDSEIAGFLDNDLTADQREVVLAHMEGCAECRQATADVSRMAHAYHDSQVSEPGARVAGKNRRRMSAAILVTAAAASIAVVVVSRISENSDSASAVRSAPEALPDARPRLHVIGPADDAVVSASSLVFSWRSSGADVYRLSVSDETGAPVLVRETQDTLVSLAGTPALPTRVFYLWRVDAIADGVTASSGVRKIRITP